MEGFNVIVAHDGEQALAPGSTWELHLILASLRAPLEEIKYSKIESPSRKFALIGISTVLPVALAIRPRMPPTCLIWFLLPLAPVRTEEKDQAEEKLEECTVEVLENEKRKKAAAKWHSIKEVI